MKIYITIQLTILSLIAFGQNQLNKPKAIANDTTLMKLSPKVEHAEPLYIDLMRDLGARKVEAEINVGFGRNNHHYYNEFNGFLEYKRAKANRLDMEVEVPF